MAGPLWIGELYDETTLSNARTVFEDNPEVYHKRVGSILDLMFKEQDMVKYPYVDLHILCDMNNLTSPKRDDVIDMLVEQGYQAVRTHFRPTAIRTDASIQTIVRTIAALIGDE